MISEFVDTFGYLQRRAQLISNESVKASLDVEINRREVPALKVHPVVLGPDSDHLFAAGVADMDFMAPTAVIDALQDRLNHGVFGYETLSQGLLYSLCHWLHSQHGWRVDENHVLRAPNILNALAIAASIFTKPGDGVIIQPPVFFDFFDILRENHRHIITNPLLLQNGRYVMDFDDLERKASDPKATMIFLCNPHNPVARVWTESELRTLSDICLRHGIVVVADEMHGDLAYPGHKYTPVASLGAESAGNTITCLSPAKTFNIAACCSAFTLISDPEKRRLFQAENSRLTVNKNNAFANVAMEAAYTHAESWLDTVLTYLQEIASLVESRLESLPQVELIKPEGTFLLWLDFRKLGLEPDELTRFLRTKAGWAVTRGEAFGEQGKGFARLNIGCTREKLGNALTRLKQALE